MNIFLTLTFFGFFAFSLATSPPKLECKNYEAKKDLDLNKYFHGEWYLTSMDKPLVAPLQVCQISKSQVKDDGTINHVISANYKQHDIKFVRAYCTANKKDATERGISFHCLTSVNSTFTLRITIIDTDYDSYGIFQACSMRIDGRILSEHIMIVRRKEDAQVTNENFNETLKKFENSVDNFVERKSVTCEDDPKFAEVKF